MPVQIPLLEGVFKPDLRAPGWLTFHNISVSYEHCLWHPEDFTEDQCFMVFQRDPVSEMTLFTGTRNHAAPWANVFPLHWQGRKYFTAFWLFKMLSQHGKRTFSHVFLSAQKTPMCIQTDNWEVYKVQALLSVWTNSVGISDDANIFLSQYVFLSHGSRMPRNNNKKNSNKTISNKRLP